MSRFHAAVGHVMRAVRFPNGDWVAGCSCATYMSCAYAQEDEALTGGWREHETSLRTRGLLGLRGRP